MSEPKSTVSTHHLPTAGSQAARRSLRTKILIVVLVSVIAVQGLVAFSRYSVIEGQQYATLERDIKATAAELERTLSQPLYNYHEREVRTIIEAKLLGASWLQAVIVEDAVTAGTYLGLMQGDKGDGLIATSEIPTQDMYRVEQRDLRYGDRSIGTLRMAFTDQEAREVLGRILHEHLAVLVLEILVLVGAIVLAIHRMVVEPLHRAVAAADAIRSGDLSQGERVATGDEFDRLTTSLEDMRSSLRRQLDDLSTANRRLEQAMRLKTSFLANMSHEIRTPMNGVIGSAQLLELTTLDGEQAELVATMQRSGEAALAVINDILDLSKIESGEMVLEQVACDLRALVDDVAGLVVDGAEAKGLSLGVAVDPSLDRPVVCDPMRLRQVLLNLSDNAVKFTPRGSVTISCSVLHRTSDAIRVVLAVRDTGIGIPPDIQSSLFQPFMQADGSTTRQFGGTGLGLTISKQLTELMGGAISLESSEKRGSTFSVELTFALAGPAYPRPRCSGHVVALRSDDPVTVHGVTAHLEAAGVAVRSAGLKDVAGAGKVGEVVILDLASAGEEADIERLVADAGAPCVLLVTRRQRRARAADLAGTQAPVMALPARARALWEAVTQAGGYGRGTSQAAPVAGDFALRGRVLLVEDHLDNRAVIRRLLEAMRIAVIEAGNGQEAIDHLAHHEVDLVVMDCQMPVMDGFAATGELRKQGCELPIIALTANALAEDRERCIAAGMDEHLAKPVTRERLYNVLSRFLRPASNESADAP